MKLPKLSFLKIAVLGILIIVLSATTITLSAVGEKRKPTKWQPIIGLNINGLKGYVDVNSQIISSTTNKQPVNTAEILFSYDKLEDITIGEKHFQIRSMVKSLIIECDSAILAPVYDMYFKEPLPTRDSLPLTGREYTSDIRETAVILNKNTLIYKILCPEFI